MDCRYVKVKRTKTGLALEYPHKKLFVIEMGEVEFLKPIARPHMVMQNNSHIFSLEDVHAFETALRAYTKRPESVREFMRGVFAAYEAFEKKEPCMGLHPVWWERIEVGGAYAFRFMFEDDGEWSHELRLDRKPRATKMQLARVNSESTKIKLSHILKCICIDVGEFRTSTEADLVSVYTDLDVKRFERCIPHEIPKSVQAALVIIRFALEVYDAGRCLYPDMTHPKKWWITYDRGVRFALPKNYTWRKTHVLIKN